MLTIALPAQVERRLSALFFGAVMFSAWYGGLGPGLVATLLSTLGIAYFLMPPYYTLRISIEDVTRLALFVLVALVISYLNDARKRAEARHADLLLHEKAARAKVEATEWRYEALREAARILTTSRDGESAMAHLAQLALPRFADACFVDVLSEDGSPRCIAEAHRYVAQDQSEPASAAIRRDGGDAAAKEFVARVLRTGRAEVTPEAVIVPLVVRGQELGAMSFHVTDSARRYGPGDVAFAQDLGRYMALAIDLGKAPA